MNESKRVSVDYQARFCLTARHVECRRFQRAVPEIPEAPARPSLAERFERQSYLVAGVIAASFIILIAAVIFRGTRSGWFDDGSVSANRGQTGSLVDVRPTPVTLGTTATPTSNPHPSSTASIIPVLSSTASPSPTASMTATTTPVPTVTPAASPAATPAPSVVDVSPSPTPVTPPSTATPATTTTAPAPTTHVVSAGETLSTIGEQYGISASMIAAANGIDPNDVISTGSTLYIPDSSGHLPPDAPFLGIWVVQPGDTLGSIASQFGVSIQNLMYENAISNPDIIHAGNVLTIPKGDVEPPVAPSTSSSQRTYTVQHGDTLSSIATQFGTTVDELMTANGLTDRSYVVTGQVLIIPSS